MCGDEESPKQTALTSSRCFSNSRIGACLSISYTTTLLAAVPATISRPSPEKRRDHIYEKSLAKDKSWQKEDILQIDGHVSDLVQN
jgi:hypothetical protein